MEYLQYQLILLFTLITIYDNCFIYDYRFFDNFINLHFILRISNANFVYYYSSKEGQGIYCYSLIVNIQNEDIGIKVLTKKLSIIHL